MEKFPDNENYEAMEKIASIGYSTAGGFREKMGQPLVWDGLRTPSLSKGLDFKGLFQPYDSMILRYADERSSAMSGSICIAAFPVDVLDYHFQSSQLVWLMTISQGKNICRDLKLLYGIWAGESNELYYSFLTQLRAVPISSPCCNIFHQPTSLR